jgi:4-hydroxybenzoate polyprenyltransferase
MSSRQNPSFFSGTASDGEFLAQFRSPQSRTRLENVFSFVTFNPMFPTVFVSAVVVAILYVSFLLQDVVIGTLLLIATFFLGISVYSLNRLTDLEEDSVNLPDRGRFFKKNRDYLLFASLESINIAVVLAFFSNPSAIIIILFAFFIAFFYGVGTHRLRLKNILLLKNITIAGTMTTAAVLLPLVVHTNIPFIVLMVAYFIFLNIFIESVLHDVRDIEGDRKAGVRTIPASLGRNKTRNLLLLLNSTLVVWVAFSLFQNIFYPYIFVLILGVFYGYWSILRFTRASATTSRPFYSLVTAKWMILALYATPFALGWPHIL